MPRIMTSVPEPRFVEKARETEGISKSELVTMKTKLATIPEMPTVAGDYKLVIDAEGVASWQALS